MRPKHQAQRAGLFMARIRGTRRGRPRSTGGGNQRDSPRLRGAPSEEKALRGRRRCCRRPRRPEKEKECVIGTRARSEKQRSRSSDRGAAATNLRGRKLRAGVPWKARRRPRRSHHHRRRGSNPAPPQQAPQQTGRTRQWTVAGRTHWKTGALRIVTGSHSAQTLTQTPLRRRLCLRLRLRLRRKSQRALRSSLRQLLGRRRRRLRCWWWPGQAAEGRGPGREQSVEATRRRNETPRRRAGGRPAAGPTLRRRQRQRMPRRPGRAGERRAQPQRQQRRTRPAGAAAAPGSGAGMLDPCRAERAATSS